MKKRIVWHEKRNEQYFLQLTIMEDSVKDKTFAQGTFSARNIFANKEGQVFEKKLPLTKTQIELDKALSLRSLEEQENAKSELGLLLISGQLHPRAKVQERYYEAIVNYYDENKNGQLEKSEVQKLLLSLDIPEDPEVFFRKYDEDANDVWSKEEIINMLKDYDFQRSPWLSLALEKF
ncbi:hypothetical protein RFI_09972 [Reticulomyxa filosa]|uniref:EF-hand domain-containing protein n=1 Tax=Reticulomyxa filosa TaxID=46433 RepID=X6NMB6_RETFI|nr:hypothetical protein RFI_09972 [Reticulomyxa filosa]|eukprot:ETO27161.1 hypothetical protein RFI_09972 [Reticulomyxa filosa]